MLKLKVLICSRADTCPVIVRDSTFDHVCHVCGARVVVAPQGRKRLNEIPDLEPLCFPCFLRIATKDERLSLLRELAASPLQEILKAVVPNLYRARN